MSRSVLSPFFVLIGTIIGAGVFALPHLFARMGIGWGSVVFWLIACLVALTHKQFVEVIVRVQGVHRLPGYVRSHLGARWGAIATFTHAIQVYGSHIAYLLLGGAFLQAVAQILGLNASLRLGILVIFFLLSTVVRGTLDRVAKWQSWATVLMILLFAGVTFATAILPAAPTFFVPRFSWMAFGIVLFSLSGLPVMGEVVELCQRNLRRAQGVAVGGTLMAAAIMWVFAVVLARYGGTAITSDPQSLVMMLPRWGALAIPVLGLLAIGTSYVTTGEDLETSWRRDYGFRESSAWAVTLLPPLALALVMGGGFIQLAAILGTVCSGANGVLVGMMRLARAEQDREPLALVLAMAVVFFFAFGMSSQLISWLLV